ncbi:hypothetical protein A1O1_05109 [Capronia coronata CBS 617.96]|uniref:Uncharacterized protein n=1 Tax=Capronia coronata CBS 617.96 TaxID=1182541 RepID=W9YES6_9EURO|nr:uncharacterized protein A1O1_05109 [Capronia coronata CBS 617.96]EXJ88180.1 hypothetical protein A1O1_05109 [Capronia coronata CBS 617.96]
MEMTLIVLTDGVWGVMVREDAVDQVLDKLTDSFHIIRGIDLLRRPVCVQFVQFGDDERGIQRLRRLDSDKRYQHIVDITPATENIFKMLLGSFLDKWDIAGDAEEGAPSPM